MKTVNTFLVSLCMLCLAALAPSAVAVETSTEPDQLINKLFQEMNEQLRINKDKIHRDKSTLVSIGDAVLGPYVSFELMAKQILGRHWRSITLDQQQRYVKAFRDRVSFTMASQYKPGEKYDLNVRGARYNSKKTRALVKSIVLNEKSGKKYLIDYKFFSKRNENNEEPWKVYDVIVEGVSLLQSFKTATDQEFNRKGIEYLIAQLESEKKQVRKQITEDAEPIEEVPKVIVK